MEATSFTLSNRLDQVEPLQNEVMYILQARGVRLKQIHAILLAFGEWLENVIQHAYSDRFEHMIQVDLSVGENEVRVCVTDDGRDFVLPESPTALPAIPPGARAAREQGLLLIRHLMDSVEHERRDARNHFTMVKQIIPVS